MVCDKHVFQPVFEGCSMVPSANKNLSDVTAAELEAEIARVRAMLEGVMRQAGLPVPLGPPRQICPSDGSA